MNFVEAAWYLSSLGHKVEQSTHETERGRLYLVTHKPENATVTMSTKDTIRWAKRLKREQEQKQKPPANHTQIDPGVKPIGYPTTEADVHNNHRRVPRTEQYPPWSFYD